MELRHLRYFVALADCLNFTRAAERVHVTQSTLSHQIRQLEDELGRQLFERIGRKVLLTEAGETFLGYASKALREVDQGLSELNRASADLAGEVRVGATPTFNMNFLPECLARFMARWPNVRVSVQEMSAEAIADGLFANSLDMGVSYKPADPDRLWFEPLHSEEMMLVVARDHPLAARKRVRMVELHKQRLIMLPPRFATRAMLDECFRNCGAEPVVAVEMDAISPTIALVAQTRLAAIVSEHALSARDDVRVIPLESPTPLRTPGLMWRREVVPSSAVKVLATEIRRRSLTRSLQGTAREAQAGRDG